MTQFPRHLTYGFSIERKGLTPPLVKQVHGSQIVEIPAPLRDGDGVLSRHGLEPIYVFTADCLPVLLASEDPQGPIAALHAGWRGARAGIVGKGIQALTGSGPVHAILGPCILACCFEVKEDFIAAFTETRGDISPFLEDRQGRWYFDLPRFVVERELSELAPALVHREALECTFCSPRRLPSYRRNKETDPRIRSWIQRRR